MSYHMMDLKVLKKRMDAEWAKGQHLNKEFKKIWNAYSARIGKR